MPVSVRKRGKKYVIAEKSGRVVGTSDSRKKAEISASKRNAAHRRKRGGK